MNVCKFGGSSMVQEKKVLDIVKNNKYDVVVVSAPGKSEKYKTKVTDLLIGVAERFDKSLFDYIVSRGEYLMASQFALASGYEFADAADYIVINKNGKVNEKLTKHKLQSLRTPCVIGGFYGSTRTGEVKTFARGGSDYTGAIIASLLSAEKYEVFTDTQGVFTADPNKDVNAKHIPLISYDEMYKMNAQVIYNDCLPLLKKYKVPLVIKSTFSPNGTYTLIK